PRGSAVPCGVGWRWAGVACRRRGGSPLRRLARGRPRHRQGACRMTSPLEQKLRITGPVVVTANRLGDGAVVYRTVDGHWTTHLAQAAVVTTTPAASELLAGAPAAQLRGAPALRPPGP